MLSDVKVRRPAVVVFGRFNPPTTGHARLIEFLQQEAGRRKALPIVFPSPSEDEHGNPLPFGEKVRYLRQLFRDVVVSGNPRIRNPYDALVSLSHGGFDAVWFVVGSDEAAKFEHLGRMVKPSGLRDGRHIILKQFGVVTLPETRRPNVAGVPGMSGTKLREAALSGDWATFRAGCPTRNDRFAGVIYESVRRHLGLV
jgi:hypothetical protein